MLWAMDQALKAKNYQAAHAYAKDAAPYLHSRLSAVDLTARAAAALEVVEEIVSAPDADTPRHGAAAPRSA
jgi:hypothetical protein